MQQREMSSDFCGTVLEISSSDDYYQMLGCDELSTTEQINTEFRHKVRKLHPDKNSSGEQTKLFQKLKRAHETLIDEEKRKSYDKWRRMGLAVPYDIWIGLSRASHTSVHWAAKPKKELMLKYEKTGDCSCSDSTMLSSSSTSKRELKNSSSSADNPKIVRYVKRSPYARSGWKSCSRKIDKFRRYEI